MKTSLTIALVQSDLSWESPDLNLSHLSSLIEKNITQPVDLIVLPEMFTTGFSMNSHLLAESMKGMTIDWMKSLAAERGCVVAGSIIIREDEQVYNRLLWVTSAGELDYYDKRHLFRMAGEHLHYSPGTDRKTFTLYGWSIMPQICYDLRFPIWSRNDLDYDILLYIASWPSVRIAHWDKLLAARAIENQAYVVAVNRVGVDPNGHNYTGHSMVVNPWLGEPYCKAIDKEDVLIQTISKADLEGLRNKLPFLSDQDQFSIDDTL